VLGGGAAGQVAGVMCQQADCSGLRSAACVCVCVGVGACVMRLNLLNSMAYNWHRAGRPQGMARQSKSGNWGKCKV